MPRIKDDNDKATLTRASYLAADDASGSGKVAVSAVLDLATPTDVGAQPVDATLTALSGLDTSTGLVEQTGADTFAKRAIGVGASGSIPTRGDADARYVLATMLRDFLFASLDEGSGVTITQDGTTKVITIAATGGGSGLSHVTQSGTNDGTTTFYDETATTGSTKVVIRTGDADANSGNLVLEFRDQNNVVRGGIAASINEIQVKADHISDSSTGYFDLRTTGFNLVAGLMMQWAVGAPYNPAEVAFGAAIAGHVAITDAGTGGVEVGQCLVGKSSTTAGREMVRGSAVWVNDTDASRTAEYQLQVVKNATMTPVAKFDAGAGAGTTGLRIVDEDGTTIARVKVGASGTGPGGSGRALYLS